MPSAASWRLPDRAGHGPAGQPASAGGPRSPHHQPHRPWRSALRAGLLAAALAAGPALAGAAQPPGDCPLTDQQFSERVDALASWADIHQHQQTFFPPCPDTGMQAQAHTEMVVRALLQHWASLSALAALAADHPEFKAFILRHVNARAGRVDLQTVMTYATIRCPRGQVGFCNQLRAAAASALQVLQ